MSTQGHLHDRAARLRYRVIGLTGRQLTIEEARDNVDLETESVERLLTKLYQRNLITLDEAHKGKETLKRRRTDLTKKQEMIDNIFGVVLIGTAGISIYTQYKHMPRKVFLRNMAMTVVMTVAQQFLRRYIKQNGSK